MGCQASIAFLPSTDHASTSSCFEPIAWLQMSDNNAIQETAVSPTIVGFGTHDVHFTASDRAGISTVCKTVVTVVENQALNLAMKVSCCLVCVCHRPPQASLKRLQTDNDVFLLDTVQLLAHNCNWRRRPWGGGERMAAASPRSFYSGPSIVLTVLVPHCATSLAVGSGGGSERYRGALF